MLDTNTHININWKSNLNVCSSCTRTPVISFTQAANDPEYMCVYIEDILNCVENLFGQNSDFLQEKSVHLLVFYKVSKCYLLLLS